MSDWASLSDREVDALVAEHLDGWRWYRETEHLHPALTGDSQAVTRHYRILARRGGDVYVLADGTEPKDTYYEMGCLPYTVSFDEALRVLRRMDWATQRRAINGISFVEAYTLGRFLIEGTPRHICEAMLDAKGVAA